MISDPNKTKISLDMPIFRTFVRFLLNFHYFFTIKIAEMPVFIRVRAYFLARNLHFIKYISSPIISFIYFHLIHLNLLLSNQSLVVFSYPPLLGFASFIPELDTPKLVSGSSSKRSFSNCTSDIIPLFSIAVVTLIAPIFLIV